MPRKRKTPSGVPTSLPTAQAPSLSQAPTTPPPRSEEELTQQMANLQTPSGHPPPPKKARNVSPPAPLVAEGPAVSPPKDKLASYIDRVVQERTAQLQAEAEAAKAIFAAIDIAINGLT